MFQALFLITPKEEVKQDSSFAQQFAKQFIVVFGYYVLVYHVLKF